LKELDDIITALESVDHSLKIGVKGLKAIDFYFCKSGIKF